MGHWPNWIFLLFLFFLFLKSVRSHFIFSAVFLFGRYQRGEERQVQLQPTYRGQMSFKWNFLICTHALPLFLPLYLSLGWTHYPGHPLTLLCAAWPTVCSRQAASLPESGRKLQQQGLCLYDAVGWRCQKSCQAEDEKPLPVHDWDSE